MSLVFYSAPYSSASPVGAALRELELPHERVDLDIKDGKHRTPEFLAINPHGKVPALVVDGTPMFEALAIMQWLGERYGVEQGLWPQAGSQERLVASAWTTWAYVSYGQALTRLTLSGKFGPEALQSSAHHAAATAEIQQMLEVLEQHLSSRKYMLGAEYSLADLIVTGVINYSVLCGVDLAQKPKVRAWAELCGGRPAWKAA